MKVKNGNWQAFFAVSAPFALIYLAPMCMVFGSSFLNGKQAVYLNLLDWIIISMLSGTTHECLQH